MTATATPYCVFATSSFQSRNQRALIPYHPNVCPSSGFVCLDILLKGKAWSAALGIEKVLLSVVALLDD